MKKAIERLKLSWAWKLFPSARLQIRTRHGIRVPLRAKGDFPSLEEMFIRQVYNDLFEHLPKPILSWVDLGCNAGILSAWICDRTVGQGERPTHALLVDPGICVETAREFVRANKLDGFQVIQACIGDGNPTTFFESKSSTRSSSTIRPCSREKERQVETETLTALLKRAGIASADLLKIDIEGAEKYVLKEEGIFERFRCGIIEWHAETTTGAQVAEWVTTHGGKIVKITSQDGTADAISSSMGMLAWVREAL